MDHHEFTETGVIGNPERATKEKGEEAFRRYSEHAARAIAALLDVEVTVHSGVQGPRVIEDCDRDEIRDWVCG